MSLLPLIPVILAQAAATQPATQPSEGDDLEEDFAAAIAADQAPAPKPATPVTSGALMNPEISVISTFAGTWRRRETPGFVAGDDAAAEGLTVQEVELSFAADVDPYFKARAFLTIPNLEGIEVEEAYLLSTSLPYNLLFKGGMIRSAFGRNNEQHLHMQDFGARPRMQVLLGDDGLKAPAAQLSLLVPLPWYTVLFAEALTLPGAEGFADTSATLVLEQFFDLSATWSLLWGLNAASLVRSSEEEPDPMAPPPEREFLFATDVYLKWMPTNVARTYFWVAVTGEYAMRRLQDGGDWDGAGYAQVVARVARRWRVGVRLEATGLPAGDLLPRTTFASAAVTFHPSEYSRVRLTYRHEEDPADSTFDDDVVILQLEGAMGAHGAHAF